MDSSSEVVFLQRGRNRLSDGSTLIQIRQPAHVEMIFD